MPFRISENPCSSGVVRNNALGSVAAKRLQQLVTRSELSSPWHGDDSCNELSEFLLTS